MSTPAHFDAAKVYTAEAEQARIGAGAADPASEQERAPADQARDVLERRLLDRVADRIDEPAKPQRIAPGEQHERAARHADDRRSGQGHEPLGGHLGDQAGLESYEPGGANEIRFISLAGAVRETTMEPITLPSTKALGLPFCSAARASSFIFRARSVGRVQCRLLDLLRSPASDRRVRPSARPDSRSEARLRSNTSLTGRASDRRAAALHAPWVTTLTSTLPRVAWL
jgi:hypothetical protein